MTTKPRSGDLPSSAQLVWLALDPYEPRPFSRIRGALLSTKYAELLPGLRPGSKPEDPDVRKLRDRAKKWADVNTSRGIDWLVSHHWALKHRSGYVRLVWPVGGRLLASLGKAEFLMRTVRQILQNSPTYPSSIVRRDGTEAVRAHVVRLWWADIRRLESLLTDVRAGLRGLRSQRSRR